MPGYVEMQVTSNYSFLRGASRIEELLLQARALAHEAIAITDRNTIEVSPAPTPAPPNRHPSHRPERLKDSLLALVME